MGLCTACLSSLYGGCCGAPLNCVSMSRQRAAAGPTSALSHVALCIPVTDVLHLLPCVSVYVQVLATGPSTVQGVPWRTPAKPPAQLSRSSSCCRRCRRTATTASTTGHDLMRCLCDVGWVLHRGVVRRSDAGVLRARVLWRCGFVFSRLSTPNTGMSGGIHVSANCME